MVDWDGLENRCAFAGTVGSNPTLSATTHRHRDALLTRCRDVSMLHRLRSRTAPRNVFVALAVLALAFKLLFPPGFMPGTSLGQPIVLCDGQAPMPAMAVPMTGVARPMAGMDHHGAKPGKPSHGGAEHVCPFAGLGATPLGLSFASSAADAPPPIAAPAQPRADRGAPGRGMAAPPPPSHAPPPIRA